MFRVLLASGLLALVGIVAPAQAQSYQPGFPLAYYHPVPNVSSHGVYGHGHYGYGYRARRSHWDDNCRCATPYAYGRRHMARSQTVYVQADQGYAPAYRHRPVYRARPVYRSEPAYGYAPAYRHVRQPVYSSRPAYAYRRVTPIARHRARRSMSKGSISAAPIGRWSVAMPRWIAPTAMPIGRARATATSIRMPIVRMPVPGAPVAMAWW